ncbi:MAG: AAA family ATPase [Deltaproteobacteria bacterium]|nr:AAA family ATPase [Deltaproteobacteria bacterium]
MSASVLAPELLRRVCDPASFDFETTAALEPVDERLGQERARRAIELGLRMPGDGYHVFAMGQPRAGKRHAALAFMEPYAATRPPSPDLIYVNRFDRPREPRILSLPPGRGKVLEAAILRLIEELRAALPGVLESDALRKRGDAIEAEVKERNERDLEAIRAASEARGVAIVGRPHGFTVAPLKNGELLTEEQFGALPEAEQAVFAEAAAETSRAMRAFMAEIPRREREAKRRVKGVLAELVAEVVAHHVQDVRDAFADLPEVVAHLDALEKHVAANPSEWVQPAQQGGPSSVMAMAEGVDGRDALLRRYGIHVLVDRTGDTRAPVVYEPHPTYENLVGAMDHIPVFGALVTDIHLVKPGALHKAHGGFLLVDARNLLMQPYAWDALKRALKTRTVTIEPLARMLGVLGGAALAPEPLALDVKVVMFGERRLFHLLAELDPDFPGLFRIAADFEDTIARTPESELRFARFIGKLLRDEALPPMTRGAVATFVEHASRMAEDAHELSVNVGDLAALLREACHFARDGGAERVEAAHVEAAIEAADHRTARVREKIHESIARGTLLVSTDGERVGQINGLTVARVGEASFGWPSRITARARMGDGRVVDIEKEVALGGPIHSKGVLILSGFLAGRYAPTSTLSLRASIVLEQSYGQIEGDSASLAELYALLSAISGLPIAQRFAITGSVNQHGDVQPIGGVNDKIEGFFDVCRERGLTGREGVIIPAANVRHLVLRQDVVAAVREGRFQVISVASADDGMEILFGRPAGERGSDGAFPEGSVNRAVEDRLAELHAQRLRMVKNLSE